MHYGDVRMGTIASQITSLTIVYSTVYSDADQRKHQSSASLAFVWGIHQGPVNSPHKWPVTRKLFPFDDVIMGTRRESRFACYSHCYVTRCHLTTGIVTSQYPSSRDAALVTRYLTPLISACLNAVRTTLPN